MAESHATLNSLGQTSTPIGLSGNFTVTLSCDANWKGVVILEKKFPDKTEYIALTNGIFLRSNTMLGNEPSTAPATVPLYRFRVFKYEEGSVYVRLEDSIA